MLRRALLLVVLLIAGCAIAPVPPYSAPRATVHKLHNSLGSASGVMVAPGVILTAGHVAEQENLLIDGVPATTVRQDADDDVGVLSTSVGCPCATISMSPPVIDEPVIVIGYPLQGVLHGQVMTEGRVQALEGNRIVLTAPAAAGNSGGGVFAMRDGEWQLIGVLIEMLGQPIDAPMSAYAPVNYLTRAVDMVTASKYLDRG